MAVPSVFRVELVLGKFFSDHKSKAYVSVNRDWNSVRQLQHHIRDIFGLTKIILTTNGGIYLPAKESIHVVEAGDILRVLPKMSTSTPEDENGASSNNEIKDVEERKQNPTTPEIQSGLDDVDMGTVGKLGKRKRVRRRKKKNAEIGIGMQSTPQKNRINSGKCTPQLYMEPPRKRNCNSHVRFDNGEDSDRDEEIVFPKKARVISRSVVGITKLKIDSGDVGFDVDPRQSSTLPTVKKEIEVDHLSRDLQIIGLNGNTPLEKLVNNNNNNSDEDAKINNKTEENQIIEKQVIIEEIESNAASLEPKETALEQLAKNLETVGKYRTLDNDIKEYDMIAFKVFKPTFEMSNYVIAMVEEISRNEGADFDLVLLIMAGKAEITHLICSTDENEQNIRIQINRSDILEAKIIETNSQ